jgi:hypothetical protein
MGTRAFVVEQTTTTTALVAGTGTTVIAMDGKGDVGNEQGVAYVI